MADQFGDGGEVSLCPGCRRETLTTRSGACAECWQAKTSSGSPVLRRRPERTEPLFDFGLDALNVLPGWVWWVIAAGVVTAIAFGVRAVI